MISSLSRSNSNRSRAFTLIELLVVIGIIVIMLAALAPAVTSLSRGGGRKGAISNLMNAMEQARTLAITSGRSTYLVFADQNTPEAYRCRAFIIFHEDADFTPQAVTKWYFLPTGISFRPNSGILAAQTGASRIMFNCPGTVGSNPRELPFVKFDSTGMVPAPTGGLRVDIFAGFVDANGQQSFTDRKQQNDQKYDAVVVARFSGRARYVNPYG